MASTYISRPLPLSLSLQRLASHTKFIRVGTSYISISLQLRNCCEYISDEGTCFTRQIMKYKWTDEIEEEAKKNIYRKSKTNIKMDFVTFVKPQRS